MSAILHLVSRHPAAGPDLGQCAATLATTDAVVLMGPAASAAANLGHWVAQPVGRWHVMAEDLDQYGIDPVQLPPAVKAISSAQLLQLIADCSSSLTW